MKDKESLVGRQIELYLNGGWSISGVVLRADDQRILVENDGLMYMAYRDKISAVCLNFGQKPEVSPNNSPSYYASEDTGLSLPAGMLTEEAQRDIDQNDFSVFFSRPELSNNDSKE